MKKLILLISIILSAFICNAQGLKGYNFGEKLKGGRKFIDRCGYYKTITTTLGGIEGRLQVQTINDRRIYIISFSTRCSLSKRELEILKKGLEYKFNIRLRSTDQGYYASKDNIKIIFNYLESNIYNSKYSDIEIIVADMDLFKIKDKEEEERRRKEQEMLNKDF